jgi:hypothetical protein
VGERKKAGTGSGEKPGWAMGCFLRWAERVPEALFIYFFLFSFFFSVFLI